MKAYITCPCSHSDKRLKQLPDIKKLVESKGIQTYVFEIGGTSEEIFKTDFAEIKSSDMIIADVSETSHGVGIEIGISVALGHKIILLLEKGNYVTKLAQGMPNTTIIEYENLDDLLQKLDEAL